MAYIRKGLGQAASLFCPADPVTNCANWLYFAVSPCCWSGNYGAPSLAAPGVPTAEQLANPNADQVVTELVNQQFAAQQAIDAANVTETAGSAVLGGTYQAGSAVSSAAGGLLASIPWEVWAAGGAVLLLMLAGAVRR
jgi:hypothetical protein